MGKRLIEKEQQNINNQVDQKPNIKVSTTLKPYMVAVDRDVGVRSRAYAGMFIDKFGSLQSLEAFLQSVITPIIEKISKSMPDQALGVEDRVALFKLARSKVVATNLTAFIDANMEELVANPESSERKVDEWLTNIEKQLGTKLDKGVRNQLLSTAIKQIQQNIRDWEKSEERRKNNYAFYLMALAKIDQLIKDNQAALKRFETVFGIDQFNSKSLDLDVLRTIKLGGRECLLINSSDPVVLKQALQIAKQQGKPLVAERALRRSDRLTNLDSALEVGVDFGYVPSHLGDCPCFLEASKVSKKLESIRLQNLKTGETEMAKQLAKIYVCLVPTQNGTAMAQDQTAYVRDRLDQLNSRNKYEILRNVNVQEGTTDQKELADSLGEYGEVILDYSREVKKSGVAKIDPKIEAVFVKREQVRQRTMRRNLQLSINQVRECCSPRFEPNTLANNLERMSKAEKGKKCVDMVLYLSLLGQQLAPGFLAEYKLDESLVVDIPTESQRKALVEVFLADDFIRKRFERSQKALLKTQPELVEKVVKNLEKWGLTSKAEIRLEAEAEVENLQGLFNLN